jgi:hypothetical protein
MKRSVLFLGLTVLAGAGIAGTADARGISAFSGRAASGTQQTCFSSNTSTGWVTNSNCGTTQSYVISLATDSNGAKTINVAVEVPVTTNNTVCHSVAVPRGGGGATVSPNLHPSQTGVATNIQLTGSNVTSQGLLFVECDVGPSDNLIQVDWNN